MASTFAAYLTYGRVVWIAHESSWVLRGLISTLGPVGFLFYLPMEAFGFFLIAKMFTVFAPPEYRRFLGFLGFTILAVVLSLAVSSNVVGIMFK